MAKKRAEGVEAIAPEGPDLDPAWRGRVRANLVAWYAGAGRVLPWRGGSDPYRILVSETMLVQTTVAAVVPFFERFLARFPTIRDLAEADPADVLKAWEGLGYYRRARQLHEAARAVVRDHGGEVPDDPDAIRALPGVGRYIAGAILSFAFGRAAPIVEANTQRVLARWLAIEADLRATRVQARLWEAAGRVVPDDDPATFNQAFMELGALVCIPRKPLCLTCPISADCRARQLGRQDAIPVAVAKVPPLEVSEAAIVVVDPNREGRMLVVRRGPGSLWDGFWEFPTIHLTGPDPARRRPAGGLADPGLAEGLRRLTGVEARVESATASIAFGVTRHKVRLAIHPATYLGGEPAAGEGSGLAEVGWATPEEFDRRTRSAATRRLVARRVGGGD